MVRRYRWILIAAAVLIALYGAATYYFSSQIVAFTRPSLIEARAEYGEASVAARGLPAPTDVSIPVAGATLSAWLFEQPGPARCGVVLSHGYRSTRYGVLKYAPLVWKRGCDVLAIDARYHGDSTGEYATFGVYEKRDLVAAVDWLAGRLEVPRARVGLLGESMGAAISLQAATLIPDIGFVAADSSFSDLRTILARQGESRYGAIIDIFLPAAMAVAGWRAGADLDDAAPVRYAARVRAPVFLVHSRDDDFTPWTHSQAIYDLISHDRKELHAVDWDAAHGDCVTVRYGEYERLFHAFLDRHTSGF
jgi:dipeptidyl aminopeptidase/acylaminoacyl peptidase